MLRGAGARDGDPAGHVVLPTSPGRTEGATATFEPGGSIGSGREVGPFRPGILCGFGEDGFPMADPYSEEAVTAQVSACGIGSGAVLG